MPPTKQLRSPFAASRTPDADADRLAKVLRALAQPVRLRILGLIAGFGGDACAVDLIAPTGLTQPTISHHLAILIDAKLVVGEVRGGRIHLSLADDRLREIAGVLAP